MSAIWSPDLSQDAKYWRDVAAQLTERYFAPAAEAVDRAQEYPTEHVERLATHGLTGLFIPRIYCGQGANLTATIAVIEAISSGCVSTPAILCVCQLGAFPGAFGWTGGSEEEIPCRIEQRDDDKLCLI